MSYTRAVPLKRYPPWIKPALIRGDGRHVTLLCSPLSVSPRPFKDFCFEKSLFASCRSEAETLLDTFVVEEVVSGLLHPIQHSTLIGAGIRL